MDKLDHFYFVELAMDLKELHDNSRGQNPNGFIFIQAGQPVSDLLTVHLFNVDYIQSLFPGAEISKRKRATPEGCLDDMPFEYSYIKDGVRYIALGT